MEDVGRLIDKVRQELGPDASDEAVTAELLKTIEAMPESDRSEVLEQLVKQTGSRELAHLRQEADGGRPEGEVENGPKSDDAGTAPS